MAKNIDYYVLRELAQNPEIETLFEECVTHVINDTATIRKSDKRSNLVFVTEDGNKVLPISVMEYFLTLYFEDGFKYDEAYAFSEKMRKLFDWSTIKSSLNDWIDQVVRDPYLYDENNAEYVSKQHFIKKSDINEIYLTDDHYQFACYIAIGFMKYGASYESANTKRIFDYVTELGSDLPNKLKKYGSGDLPKNITEYKDDDIIFKANDAFATIKISIKNNTEDAYSKVFDYLNNLLKHDFPKSYSLEVKGACKFFLPIKGMPKKGINQLFANAVGYPGLYHKIEQYANLAMKEFEWYTNLDDENGAMPGSFAVFALGLEDRKYDSLIQKCLNLCDDEHSEIQGKFLNAYFEKYGLDSTTIPILLSGVASMQGLDLTKVFNKTLVSEESLNVLLSCKNNMDDYLYEGLIQGKIEDEVLELKEYLWEDTVNSLFGWEPEKTVKALPKELRELAQEVAI